MTDTCKTHTRVADERGPFAAMLPVTACEFGADYGVWDVADAGFLCTFDCAMESANYAAELLAEDAKQEFKILRECHDHPGQPDNGCVDCFDENGDDEFEDGEDKDDES